jgi:hypothetical protein
LSFSLVPAALWPSIPRIVDEENIATAYGMMVRNRNFRWIIFLNHINAIATATDRHSKRWLGLD